MAKSPVAILVDKDDPTKFVGVTEDRKLKVSTLSTEPPDGATQKIIAGDDPLSVSTTQTASWTIPDGKRFYLQQVQAGAAGDPTEKGSAVEVYFNDGTDHLIARIYLMGTSVFVPFPDLAIARDGTDLDGSGTSNSIRLVRRRVGTAVAQEVDAIAIGYYKDIPA